MKFSDRPTVEVDTYVEAPPERVWEIACRYTLPGATNGVRLVPAALEDDSGIVGAAALAKSRVTAE